PTSPSSSAWPVANEPFPATSTVAFDGGETAHPAAPSEAAPASRGPPAPASPPADASGAAAGPAAPAPPSAALEPCALVQPPPASAKPIEIVPKKRVQADMFDPPWHRVGREDLRCEPLHYPPW